MSHEDTRREEGFLSRWSKRKRAGVAEEAAASSPALVEGAPAAPPAVEPEREFDLASLPSLDELTGASDISVFLQKGVPEALKNAALRKAWVLDPMIKNHIEPVECGWDFNDPTSMAGFGPLDADTDAAAMLRQIMGEKEPVAAGTDAAEPAHPAHADPADVEAGTVGTPDKRVAGDDADADNPPHALSLPSEATAMPLSVSSDADEAVQTSAATLPPMRKRRHGGAVPG
ncbi:MAG: hypothetical protein FD175_679 [Beijerinckiaceae bacterium]|nr:MAG: hypothetical protein FD175_679 [Beijerinckiaceae bacterium]